MTFFAQELKKIADRSELICDPKYVGRVCMFRLSDDITGKMEFATEGVQGNFSAIKITLFNRKEGVIDTQKTSLVDIIGMKPLGKDRSSPIRSETEPHIWIYGKEEWYGFTPTDEDYSAMAQSADDYIGMFADLEQDETMDMGM
jgi:hypothetical protein